MINKALYPKTIVKEGKEDYLAKTSWHGGVRKLATNGAVSFTPY